MPNSTTRPPHMRFRGRSRRRGLSAAAFAAASALVLSSCGALAGLDANGTGGRTAGPSSPAPSASASGDGDMNAFVGKTSNQPGTKGMQPFGTMSPVEGSAAQSLPGDPATDSAYSSFYTQKLSWGECEDPAYAAAQCATIKVPLAWNKPDGATLELLLTKRPANSKAVGSLLVNPGGPGGSGAQLAAEHSSLMFTEELLDSYDIIGFDPRGVKDSSGIQCLSDAETDELLSLNFDESSPEGARLSEQWNSKVAGACEEHSGDVLPYLDTYSVARDMDVIRALVGSEKLNYLGFSYGTYLGATYAEMYPDRVGRMVLDAAVDPAITADELSAGQAEGFENAIKRFATWCLDQDSCPLSGTPDDGVQQIRDLMASVEKTPLDTNSGRPLTAGLLTTGIIVPLYGDELWPTLSAALGQAMKGNGSAFLAIADFANERDPNGKFTSNSMYALSAVNCLDHPGVVDEQWVEKESERLASTYPTFGSGFGGAGLGCQSWPAPAVRVPAPAHYTGSSPIVVIGTTHDPATPYQWSKSLRDQLGNAVLLTYNGDGHTAYGRAGGCIEKPVDNYLIRGQTPQDGLTCEAE